MLELSYRFLIIIAIIFTGYLLKKLKFLKQSDGNSLAKVIFNFTLPALVISVFKDFNMENGHVIFPVLGVLIGFVMLGISFLSYRKFSRRDKGMLTMPLLGLNIGLFAIPFVDILWGGEAVKYLMLMDLGNAFVIFVVCYITGAVYAGESDEVNPLDVFKKALHSIPLLVYLLTFILIVTRNYFPKPIVEIADIVSSANTPLAMITLGVFLSFKFDKSQILKMLRFWFTKYIIGILISAAILIFTPFDDVANNVMVLAFILPSSFSSIAYAVELNYDSKFIGTIINSTIVISIGLMWILSIFIV